MVELLAAFGRHEVPFLIAGGYAVAHAGHVRATKDVDLFVPRTPGASARLASALTDFLGAPVTQEQTEAQFLRFFVDYPGAFDIIRKLPGVTWTTAWRERSTGPFFGRQAPFLGIDTLIRNKRAVGRHVDLADVEQLVRIRAERRQG
ncbi:MAG: hypothetical protein AB1Z98_04550 [Nannocystaceae bacterium]